MSAYTGISKGQCCVVHPLLPFSSSLPILALVLYVWSCRRTGLEKHSSNQTVTLIIPFEFGDLKGKNGRGNGCPLSFKCSPDKDVQNEGNVRQEEDKPD